MKTKAFLLSAYFFPVLSLAQPFYSQIQPGYFMTPPDVPGYQACETLFNSYIDCQPGWVNHGQPSCPAISLEFSQTLNCPAVFRWQARVNARVAAGMPPPVFNENELRIRPK